MTSLVCWLSCDSRGPASLYIATDSRFSISPGTEQYDHGRKTFAGRFRSEIFGFAGSAKFPCNCLAQVSESYSGDQLIADADRRFEEISELLKKALSSMSDWRSDGFRIVVGIRESEKMVAKFRVFELTWDRRQWTKASVELPDTSDVVLVGGSGAASVQKWKERWFQSSQGGTSRAVFCGFSDAVLKGEDRQSGGMPQVAGLYRIGFGRTFGFVDEIGKASYLGLPVAPNEDDCSAVEWRNRWFERCDSSGARPSGAKKHHVPRGLGRTKPS